MTAVKSACVRCGGPRGWKKHYCDRCRIQARREMMERREPRKKLADARWWAAHPDKIAIYQERQKNRRYKGPKQCATIGCGNTFDNRRPHARRKFCDECARLFRTRAPYSRVGRKHWPHRDSQRAA